MTTELLVLPSTLTTSTAGARVSQTQPGPACPAHGWVAIVDCQEILKAPFRGLLSIQFLAGFSKFQPVLAGFSQFLEEGLGIWAV